jgi:hypothetical protein
MECKSVTSLHRASREVESHWGADFMSALYGVLGLPLHGPSPISMRWTSPVR